MKRILPLLIAVCLLAGPAPMPAHAQICGKTYKVQAGETLYSIAEKCRLSYVVLVSINFELSDPGLIYPDQIIRLEAEAPLEFFQQPEDGPAQPGGRQGDGTYIVRPGDSLARIAFLYNTTLWDLIEANPLLNGGAAVTPGQVVRMPPSARKEKGWVGLSTLSADGSDEIDVRVVDFPPYADIEFRLGVRDESDYAFATVEARTDARGEARGTIEIPWFAWRGEIWEVRVVTTGEAAGEDIRSVSAGIRIIN